MADRRCSELNAEEVRESRGVLERRMDESAMVDEEFFST